MNAISSRPWTFRSRALRRYPQRLILQPQIELNFYTKDDRARLVGAGLSEFDAGLRLRYEITRQFAPYAGITHLGQSATADYVSGAGDQLNSFASRLASAPDFRKAAKCLRWIKAEAHG